MDGATRENRRSKDSRDANKRAVLTLDANLDAVPSVLTRRRVSGQARQRSTLQVCWSAHRSDLSAAMHRNGPFSTMWYRGLAGSTQHAVLWLITLFFTVILAHKLTTSTALGYPGVVVMLT
jgi:hypothetical protein